ncbi:MAG: glycosyltransferase family 39 protein [Methanospirillum sp.]|uniref:ArnT family glycosyltransferase n=1 Tax=Methanospirillum sp. TaxID=45200 RepID=UPI00236B739B|nr:glycosyltransferase family 39 protein [Methanospirillum sp.]MDD1729212.1 glycosyltransferase family 39 protein [Methanospirillum sp.]
MRIIRYIRKYQAESILLGILILASFLYLWNLGKEGYSNSYYAAAVKSMLTNPDIILYNSFDPSGFVTIDKPPVSLWVQTLSAAILGFSGTSLILPQVIAGLLSILLLYLLISHSWGRSTGLIAAGMLTITPIFVAVVRTNNMDGLLVFVLLAALWAALQAWRTGSLWYLLGSAVLIGIGFNIKMIQAFAVVPACFGIYLLANRLSWRTKLIHLGTAGILLLVVSASWAMMMDLTPVDQRPYIGSSSTNSMADLIFGYNGLNRIVGGFGPFGKGGSKSNSSFSNLNPEGSPGMNPPGMGENTFLPTPPSGGPGNPGSPPPDPGIGVQGYIPPSGNGSAPGSPPSGMGIRGHQGGMPGMNDGGAPGLFRMGDTGMSGQISWLLPFVLLGLLTWLVRPNPATLRNLINTLTLNERAVVTLALLLWLVPELIYFSFTTGFYHTYYVVMVAIPLAGLVGISATTMYEAYLKPGLKGWILIVAILVTGIVQWQFIMYNPDFFGFLAWIVLIGSICTVLLLAALRLSFRNVPARLKSSIVALALVFLCIAPFIWSCTPLIYPENAVMPSAGPGLMSGGDGPGSGMYRGFGPEGGLGNSSSLFSYLEAHQAGETYLVGVESSRSASDLIITYGASVMAMGGFSGSDPILTSDTLKKLINSGKIRYFTLDQGSRGKPGRENSDVTTWIRDSCPVVPSDAWSHDNQSFGPGSALYDCKGVA